MKKTLALLLCLGASSAFSQSIPDPFFPKNEYYSYDSTLGIVTGFANCVGDAGNTNAAIHVSGKIYRDGKLQDKYSFSGWASGYKDYLPGSGITGSGTDFSANVWMNPENALGKASASDTSAVVVLGDGGSIVLTFDNPIFDGEGYDFVVFENALNDTFLELAFVEVSTDGEHFVRFPNFYLGDSPVGSDGESGDNDPVKIYNLGDKYRIGYGTGYDIGELDDVYEYISSHGGGASDTCIFSDEYVSEFLSNYSYLNTDEINYVRIVDIVGDGNTLDSSGSPIYDAYPTTGTSGFDLDAVGVINANIPEASIFSIAAGLFAPLFALRKRR